ncbi:TPA: hypothetical protein RFV54_003721 [Klebsiella aerogenes]|nr:hypothetical protein [Klebsiella aerogenes]
MKRVTVTETRVLTIETGKKVKKLQLDIDPDLFHAFKVECAKRQVPMVGVVSEFISQWINDN